LTFSELHYFIWDNTSQSTKRKNARNLTRISPLATPMPAGDLLGPCGRPGARGHHVGDPCYRDLLIAA